MATRKLLLLLISSFVLLGCGRQSSPNVDENLLGLWLTDNERYEDRFFEIQTEIVRFGVRNGEFSEHRIKGVSKGIDKTLVTYTISYLTEGNEYETSFIHDTVNDTIVFLNQKDIIWLRK